MPNFREKISAVRDKAVRYLTSITEAGEDPIPKEKSPLIGQYVTSLWEDGKLWYETAFAKTKYQRFDYATPEAFIQALSQLDNGNDWATWGYRDEADYEQEFSDGEIGDQVRARNAYFNANWHDVTISPNINGINEIFDQERKATGWGKSTRGWTRAMESFGEAWVKSCLDKTANPNGVARELKCRPLSVNRTPNTTSHEKIAGCWYLIHGEQVNDKWIKKTYPKFDLSQATDLALATPKFNKFQDENKSYSHTKMYNKLEGYLDDDTLEELPFTQETFDQRIGAVLSGEFQEVLPLDNHPKFVRAYFDWLEEKEKFYAKIDSDTGLSPAEAQNIDVIISTVTTQIAQHEQAIDEANEKSEETGIKAGKRKKYPFGRYIVTLNGVVAEDIPNPYADKENNIGRDWRCLWHNPKNEDVPERIDGRGDIEILMPTAKVQDTMLSHFADDEILNMHRKPFLTSENKALWTADPLTNDPTKPFFYVGQPPIFADASGGGNSLEMYKIFKGNAKQKLGINRTTFGESDPNVTSGTQAQINLSQNEIIITGEANHNINDAVEDIIETRIYLWKLFYTDPRPYVVDGEQVTLILAHYLKDVDQIQVSVRPYSNFPMKWENDIAFVTTLAAQLSKIPPDSPLYWMVLDMAAIRYPSLAKGGKYQMMGEATKIGMAIMQRQQELAAQQQDAQAQPQRDEQDILDRTKTMYKNKIARGVLESQGVAQ